MEQLRITAVCCTCGFVFVLKASKIDEALSQFFGEGSSFSPEGYFATDYCVMSRCEIG